MIDIMNKHYEPNLEEVSEFIRNPLFDALCEHLTETYQPICKIEYSGDTLAAGWNVKFRKAGRALCVIYPRKHTFTVLVVIGRKQKERVEQMASQFSPKMSEIYHASREGNGQRWLMIDLREDDALYRDTLQLIQIRRDSR
jgi:AraC family transcriptional regulator